MFRRRKIAQTDSPKLDRATAQKYDPIDTDSKALQNGNLSAQNISTFDKQNLDSNCNNVKSYVPQDATPEVQKFSKFSDPEATFSEPEKTSFQDRRMSKDIAYGTAKRRTSLKSDIPVHEEPSCHRRVSVSAAKTTPKKKAEYGTHVVSKSELWDTGSQHRCTKTHQKNTRVGINQEDGKKAWIGKLI